MSPDGESPLRIDARRPDPDARRIAVEDVVRVVFRISFFGLVVLGVGVLLYRIANPLVLH